MIANIILNTFLHVFLVAPKLIVSGENLHTFVGVQEFDSLPLLVVVSKVIAIVDKWKQSQIRLLNELQRLRGKPVEVFVYFKFDSKNATELFRELAYTARLLL
jgi:hypothetical protein